MWGKLGTVATWLFVIAVIVFVVFAADRIAKRSDGYVAPSTFSSQFGEPISTASPTATNPPTPAPETTTVIVTVTPKALATPSGSEEANG